MVTPQIVDYIKSTLAKGFPEERVRGALSAKGWTDADVSEALRIAKGIPRPITQNTAQAQEKPPVRTQAAIQAPNEIRQSENAQTQASAAPQTRAPQLLVKQANKRPTLIVAASCVFVLAALYVGFGLTTGITISGINLFPFKAQNRTGIQAPSPTPSQTTAAETPTAPTPQDKSFGELFYGDDADARTMVSLSLHPRQQKVLYVPETLDAVWVRDVVSGSKDELVSGTTPILPTSTKALSAAWSPSGAALSFVVRQQDGATDLFVVDPQEKTSTQLTYGGGVSTDEPLVPTWAPNGTEILAYIGQDVWRISTDGSRRTKVTAGLPFGEFAWSHDGMRIAYTIKKPGEERVWVMDADGKNYHPISSAGAYHMPRFSLDDKTLTYIQHGENPAQDALWQSNVDGSESTKLIGLSGIVLEYIRTTNGQKLAFLVKSPDGHKTIWVSGADGGGLKQLTTTSEYEPWKYLAWDAEGTKLFVAGENHFLLSFVPGL